MRNSGNKRVLLEANGGITSKYLVDAVVSSGAIPIGSDIHNYTSCAAMGYESIVFPKVGEPNLWQKIEELIKKYQITDVLPTLDETLEQWSERKDYFSRLGCNVHISTPRALNTFQDKWTTYQFFKKHNIPTPLTSLSNIYELTKPRRGRGSSGIEIGNYKREMTGVISQQICMGCEYTIDILIRDKSPVYIVPRKRLSVANGKSVKSSIYKTEKFTKYIEQICEALEFDGAINIQCFETDDQIKFIEINPRFGGGTALSFAGTENWVSLIINGYPIGWKPKKIKYGLNMVRFYEEFYF